MAEACRSAGRFAVDTETDGTDPMRARLVGVSLAHQEGSAVYIPLGHDYLGRPDQLSIETVREKLGPLLSDPSVGKIAQNLKYDSHILRRHGLPVRGWSLDTMVGAFLLDPGRPTFSMDRLAEEYLDYETIKYEEVAGTGAKQLTLNEIEVDRVTEYAAEDADVTLRLAVVIEKRLEECGLSELYETVDGPLLPVLVEMEAAGIRVDPSVLGAMSIEMDESLGRSRAEIHRLAGVEFNVDSPKQLREVLFEKMGLKPRRKTAKSGVSSTDARTLEELADEHEIARVILAYRELAKLKGTYVDALPRLVNDETGRVHTSYHPTGAATGRLSSSDPNLQNIPARTETGLKIRSAFVPEPGQVFLASDYSQVELRILAHLCQDPELVAAFRQGEDVHRRTASRVFGVDDEQVTDSMRRRAKAVNFGILYGMSETRLAREQGISRTEAHAFIEAYFDRFREVKAYIERVREEARREGSVRTLFGRVRHFPQLRSKAGRGVREQALRAAVNTTIQGTAADLMKMAMLRVAVALREAGSGARMLLQVHDELLLEVPEAETVEVRSLVRTAMEEVHPMDVPLVVDQKTGRNWMEVT
jgi:DNA polymerase-1